MARFEGGGGGGGYDPTAIHKPSGSATPGNLVEWGANKTVVDSNLSTQTIEDTFTDLQANKADDVDVVHLAGVETITGQKTFTQHPHAPTPNNSDNTTHVATTAFVQSVASAKIEDQIQNNVTDKAPSQNAVFDALALKANDNQVVHLAGAETINGVKTFASYPEKSATYTAPTTDLQLVPKKWVDDNKMPKQPTAVNNNVPMFNAFGELVDSGKAATLLGTIGDGEVNTFAELPAASTKNGEVWLVKTTTGVIYVNRKVAGLYVSNGTAWTLIMPIDVDGYQKLIPSATANNLVKMDANGQVQDSGVALSTLTAINTFDRWVDNVIGSDLYTSNSKLFPYATISKALTGAQYPLKVHLIGQSYTENIALASSQSNITIGAEFCAQSGLQTELNGTITTSSGFTRLRLLNLTINSGTSTPITLASGDLGRHVIDNVSLQTTNTSLISIPTNFQNWIDMVGVDVSGASTSVLQLPTLVGTTATLTLKRLKGVLNISAGTNSGWTIYLDSDCVINWVGGYKGTLVLPTGTPKIDVLSIVTNNTSLVANIKASSGIGMHVCNFIPVTSNWASSTSYAVDQLVYYLGALFLCTAAHVSTTTFDPTKFVNTNLGGIAQGDIFYKAGAYINAIFYPFSLAPSTINVIANGTYNKGQASWQIAGSSIWGAITGTISSQTDLQNALNAKQNSLSITPTTSNAHQVVRIKPDGTGYETSNNVPTLTTAQRNAITNIPTNHIIFNSTTQFFEKYNGTTWDSIGTFTNWYAGNFLSTDFSNGVLNVLASTHGLGVTGDLLIRVLDSTYYDMTGGVSITIDNTTGNIKIEVIPGAEFNGRILILKPVNNPQTFTLQDNSVTNAKMAQMPTATIKGRVTAGTGNSEDLTSAQATSILSNFVGDSGTGGTKGLVPAPASGDASAGKALFANGTWGVVSGPAFSAGNTLGTRQSVPSGTSTKITFNSEKFDTNNNFANSRFTPTVAGYYRISGAVRFEGSSGTGECYAKITKNGAEEKRGTNFSGVQLATNYFQVQVNALVYCNGTTDYIELEAIQTSGGNRDVTNVDYITYFDGNFVRGA